ncbi:fimbrial protein [Serratia odorifera]|uniref:fimbrial protein n=1 Tax=Serratia odorifera TaxID=618 RepID=UPI0018E81EA9|nr:fimbrial protein [Serratia odorifera]MBJ2066420.1 fimbrial protein [Serratia odorifera]
MKKSWLYSFAPVLGATATLLSGHVYAGCTLAYAGTQTSTISALSMKIQRDAPIGTILAEQPINTRVYAAYCDGAAKGYGLMTYAGGVSDGNNIYRTNLPGIGIRVSWSSVSFANPAKVWTITYNEGYYSTRELIVQFVKTGPVTAGMLNPGRIGKYYVVSDVDQSSVDITIVNMAAGNTVIQQACSLNASNIQVPLGDVLATEFTGVGTTLKPKAFNVGLNCDANAKINVSLGGTQSAESSDSSILQLTNAGSAGVAKGVGVQLLYNNTPLKLNQLLALKTSAGGQETFPFTAHYYQTAANITAGSANATATLNISYQ